MCIVFADRELPLCVCRSQGLRCLTMISGATGDRPGRSPFAWENPNHPANALTRPVLSPDPLPHVVSQLLSVCCCCRFATVLLPVSFQWQFVLTLSSTLAVLMLMWLKK
eukprot:EG_transcript_52725